MDDIPLQMDERQGSEKVQDSSEFYKLHLSGCSATLGIWFKYFKTVLRKGFFNLI